MVTSLSVFALFSSILSFPFLLFFGGGGRVRGGGERKEEEITRATTSEDAFCISLGSDVSHLAAFVQCLCIGVAGPHTADWAGTLLLLFSPAFPLLLLIFSFPPLC